MAFLNMRHSIRYRSFVYLSGIRPILRPKSKTDLFTEDSLVANLDSSFHKLNLKTKMSLPPVRNVRQDLS